MQKLHVEVNNSFGVTGKRSIALEMDAFPLYNKELYVDKINHDLKINCCFTHKGDLSDELAVIK